MLRLESDARAWSNREIKRALAPLNGVSSVINVSGFDDKDKESGHYRDYFPTNTNYYLSYFPTDGVKGKSEAHCTDAFPVDLMSPLTEDMVGRFDLAFSHTVLEHVPNPFVGFQQIVKMSNDLVLTICPFRQELHFISGSFGDYFRMTPMGMRYLNEINGLKTLFESTTPSPARDIYIVSLATKQPERHSNYPHQVPDIDELNHRAGRQDFADSFAHVVHSAMRRTARAVGLGR